MLEARGTKKLAEAIGCHRSIIMRLNRIVDLPVTRTETRNSMVIKYYDVEKCREILEERYKSKKPDYLN